SRVKRMEYRRMRMNEALLALTEAVRIARLEIECYYDDRCRGSAEGTVKRLAETLCNQDINAAMALVMGDQESPSIVPQHAREQRHSCPSISPLGPSLDPVHFVLCDFGRLGSAYIETEPVTTEKDVAHALLTGQYDRPLEVVAFSVSEGWARDVSEDVAGLVV